MWHDDSFEGSAFVYKRRSGTPLLLPSNIFGVWNVVELEHPEQILEYFGGNFATRFIREIGEIELDWGFTQALQERRKVTWF